MISPLERHTAAAIQTLSYLLDEIHDASVNAGAGHESRDLSRLWLILDDARYAINSTTIHQCSPNE